MTISAAVFCITANGNSAFLWKIQGFLAPKHILGSKSVMTIIYKQFLQDTINSVSWGRLKTLYIFVPSNFIGKKMKK